MDGLIIPRADLKRMQAEHAAMLEALKELLAWAEHTGGWEAPAWAKAERAVSKAEGHPHG